MWRTGSLEVKTRTKSDSKCSVEECNRRVLAKDLCSMHYQRWKVTGSTEPKEKGKIYDSDGYIIVNINGKQVKEHRLIMSASLGRSLLPGETVHHINGDRSDNNIENLQLRQGHHGSGIVMRCFDCGSSNVGSVPIKETK